MGGGGGGAGGRSRKSNINLSEVRSIIFCQKIGFDSSCTGDSVHEMSKPILCVC